MLSSFRTDSSLKGIVLALAILSVAGCELPEETIDSGFGIARDCGVGSLEDAANLRTLSDDCKMALLELLPELEDNLANALVPLGYETLDGKSVLFFAAADAEGLPLPTDKTQITRVTAISADAETVLDTAQYALNRLREYPGRKIAVSAIVDYSGSMSDSDLTDTAEIYHDIFDALETASSFVANVLFFSDSVNEMQPFTTDATLIQQALQPDVDYERKTTAFFDAIGTGLTGLADRDEPIRLLVVATDGRENASQTYTQKDALYNLAREQRIPVIILGALLADLPLLREMAKETNGIFMYNRLFLYLKRDFSRLSAILAETIALELHEQQQEWERIRIEVNGKRIELPLNR